MFGKLSLNNIKKISARIVTNRHNIRKDATLVGQHVSTIPNIGFPLFSDREIKSELDPRNYQSIFDIFSIVHHALVPSERRSFSEGTLVCHPNEYAPDQENSKWFFINGIATSPPVALLNGKELARVFQRPINLIHTPTYSAIWDLYDSFIARTLRKDGYLSRPAFQVILKALEEQDKVVLICHSQGTIVSSYITRKLKKNPEIKHLLEKLEIYCVAGVADSFKVCEIGSAKHNRLVPYVEHFVNDQDFFARIGTLAYQESTDGKLFRANKRGHLLNDHYIGGIMRGEYCNGHSRLFKYVGGGLPTHADYHSH